MNKQIEEMARIIFKGEINRSVGDLDCSECTRDLREEVSIWAYAGAKALYNIGYRKQSEGEWIDKPTGAYGRMQSWCSACGKHSGIGGIQSNRHKPFCPNCGAKMKGGAE